jgi:cation diffusion facilitator CzcD-associated flavoprotein CzcO
MSRPDYIFKQWQRKLLKIKWIYYTLRYFIYWGLESRVIGFKYSSLMLTLIAKNSALKHIKKQIKDPNLREKITPNYTIGCKRIILSDELYPTFCKPNVSVFSKNQGIKEITKNGIIKSDGQEIELDLIIYATGFDATDGAISYPVIGKDKKKLSHFWEEFPRAYLGTSMPGFPNLFIVTGPNTGIGHTSAIFIIEVNSKAEARYTKRIHDEMSNTVWKNGGCTSWYQSKSGHVIAMFPGFSFTFRRWAKKIKLEDHNFQ